MSEPSVRQMPGFQTAAQLWEEQRRRGSTMASSPAADTLPTSLADPNDLVVSPVVGLEQAKRIWNTFLLFRDAVLRDPACYDEIGGAREMNRTGATRLAVPFGLSIEERSVEEGRVELADEATWDYRFRVRVRVSKGGRFVDGVGSCRLSEISEKAGDLSRREHFALTKAWTRATKRAIADILGGTGAE
ncbi:MAG: hypothetical protein ACRD6W_04415 [Nitrososphaerales archaeon]